MKQKSQYIKEEGFFADPEKTRGGGEILFQKTANQEIKQSLNYIPKELRVILEIATEELPEKRYDSIEQFKSDIEKFMRGEEIDFERKTLFNRIKDIFHF